MTARISAATVVVVAFFAAALLPRATWPLIDPDVWWHIRAGETVLNTGAVPHNDSWSLTAFGQPWTSQDWLSNVLMALLFRLGPWGETLLSLFAALLAVAAFAILWNACRLRRTELGWLSRVVWFSAALVLAGPILGVRVQVLDLLFAAIVIWLLWRFLADRRRVWPALLVPTALLWVNLHAGFPLLFLFGGAILVGEAGDRLLRRRVQPAPLGWSDLVWLATMLALSAAALVVNPNGLAIYAYPFTTLGLGALAAFVGEWQPARLSNIFGWLLLAFTVLGTLPTLLLAVRRLRLADAFILIGLTAMAISAVRFLLFLGPIGAAVIAINLGPWLSETQAGIRVSGMLRRMAVPRANRLGIVNSSLVVALIVLGAGLALARSLPPVQDEEIGREFPVEATTWLAEHAPDARVFNLYEWGGYLGLKVPTLRIFADGRADVYGDAVIRQYVSVIGLDSDPQATFDRYDVDHVVMPADSALGDWLGQSPQWKPVFSTSMVGIWASTER
jgi:hypothetical protein